MRIHLNDPNEFTREKVRALIASKDDTQHRQLRVTRDGFAYLSDRVGAEGAEGHAFVLETWAAGNDYVGQAASEDDAWVDQVYRQLRENWPQPKSRYVDF